MDTMRWRERWDCCPWYQKLGALLFIGLHVVGYTLAVSSDLLRWLHLH
jgi:hypothetical protein